MAMLAKHLSRHDIARTHTVENIKKQLGKFKVYKYSFSLYKHVYNIMQNANAQLIYMYNEH